MNMWNWFKKKILPYHLQDRRYPTDEQVASAMVVYAPNKFSNVEAYNKIDTLSPGERRELFAMFFMISDAMKHNSRSVSPGIEPPYELVIPDLLREFGFEVEFQGFTHKISW